MYKQLIEFVGLSWSSLCFKWDSNIFLKLVPVCESKRFDAQTISISVMSEVHLKYLLSDKECCFEPTEFNSQEILVVYIDMDDAH